METKNLRWILEAWGSHVCPYCGYGQGDDYIGKAYPYCPNCGKPVDYPEMKDGNLIAKKKEVVWDLNDGANVEMPAEMQAFLDEIEAACWKHGFSIAHEDNQGSFEIRRFSEEDMAWLRQANKGYLEG